MLKHEKVNKHQLTKPKFVTAGYGSSSYLSFFFFLSFCFLSVSLSLSLFRFFLFSLNEILSYEQFQNLESKERSIPSDQLDFEICFSETFNVPSPVQDGSTCLTGTQYELPAIWALGLTLSARYPVLVTYYGHGWEKRDKNH